MKEFDVTDEALFDASPRELFAAFMDEASGRSQWWRPTLEIHPRPGMPTARVGSISDVRIPRRRRPIHFTLRLAELVENERARFDYSRPARTSERALPGGRATPRAARALPCRPPR